MTLTTIAETLSILLLLSGNPTIKIPETPTIPYSEPTKQQHKIPEAIYSEQKYNFSQEQAKF